MVKTSKHRAPARKRRYRFEQGKFCVELRIKDEKQLFDYRDPAPFRERDLDEDAVNYIVSSVKEFSLGEPLKLTIQIGTPIHERKLDNLGIIEAIRSHFDYEADLAQKNIRFRLKLGQLGLITGIVVLAMCLLISDFLTKHFADNFLGHTLATGFNISGWVAMWYPSNTFIYEWWPLELNKRVFRKISNMEIDINQL